VPGGLPISAHFAIYVLNVCERLVNDSCPAFVGGGGDYVNAYIDVTWLVLSLRSDLKVSFAEVLLYCCSRDVAYLHGILLCRLVWLNRSETLWWYLPSRLVRDFLRGYLRLL
jgi:hypothetical protein